MTYRLLAADDQALVLGMNTTFREGFISEKGAGDFLADPDNWLFAAVEEERIVAFAYGYALHRLDGGTMLYIHEVGVEDARQRQGIGTRLMEELKKTCREAGIRKLFLITDQENAGANALYTKVGGDVSCDSQGRDRMYWFQTNCE